MLNLKRFNPLDIVIDLTVSFLFGKVVSGKNGCKITTGMGVPAYMYCIRKGDKTYVVKLQKFQKCKHKKQ